MKLKKYRSKKYRRGSILGLVLVIGLCLALLGFGMLKMGFGARVNSAISVSSITAREAADAGIAKALYEMNLNFPALPVMGERPPVTLDNSDAVYQYRVDPNGENYLITSEGFSDRGQTVVYAITGIRNILGPYAIIVSDKIELKESSIIDGYNSNNGPYSDENSGLPGVKIGTTYAGHDYRIYLRNYVVVDGHVLVGVGGDVDEIIWDQANPGATTGPRYAMTEQHEFEDVNIPTVWDTELGDIDPCDFDPNSNYTINELIEGRNVRCNDISIPHDSNLYIVGDVNLCVLGDLDLDQGAQLIVEDEPWSSVRIFLYGGLTVGQGAEINNETFKPRNFWLYGAGTSPAGERWIINNSGWYYGVYSGPNAIIDVRQSAVFLGRISGRDFTLANSGQVHYDVDLSLYGDYDTGFRIDRWWEE